MTTTPTIPRSSICRGCEYDLTGLSAPGVCPECGREFQELAGDDRIELDWTCLRCGYSLLGFRRDQACSECGTLAGLSLDTTLFRFQPTEYRKRVRSGALWVALGLVSMFLFPLFLGFAISLLLFAMSGSGAGVLMEGVMAIATLGALAMYLLGWFRILGRPPVSLGLTHRQERTRKIARSSLIVFTVLFVVSFILSVTAIAAGINPAFGGRLDAVIQIVLLLSYGVFFFAGLLALRPLFARARTAGKRPGGIATVTFWLGVISVVGLLCSAPFFLFAFSAGTTGAAAFWFGVIFGISTIVGVVACFCFLGTTESLRSALRRVDREIAAAHRRRLPSSPAGTGETPGAASPNNQPA